MVTSLNGTRVAPGYNGNPTGPTLRVKPGDVLTVTLINNLQPGLELDKELYAYTKDFSADAINRTIVSLKFIFLHRSVVHLCMPPFKLNSADYILLTVLTL